MIYIIRSNSIISDSRVKKYLNFFNEKKIKYHVIGWNRTDEQILSENSTFYTLKCDYNQGGLKALLYRIKWMLFILKRLINHKNTITLIHACDLDTAFPSAIYKFFFNRKVKLVFDIFDWYSDNFYSLNRIILKIIYFMELFSVRTADEIIICEPERVNQIKFKIKKKPLILPNIPTIEKQEFNNKSQSIFPDKQLILSYVGGFNNNRFLLELLDLAEKGNVNLLIAGFGDKNLERRCVELSTRRNIKYFGKVDYWQGLNIMNNSDIIYAFYCISNPNHIYAAPNKYYECMMLGKPILTNKGTSISNKVLDYNIGFVINESFSELEEFCSKIKKEELHIKGQNANYIWNKKYKTYVNHFLHDVYLNILK